MDPALAAILRSFRKQRDYAQRLTADLTGADMVRQPISGITLNHAAWTLSHLAPYPPILAAILRQEPFEDPLNSPAGRGSTPLPDAAAYPPKAALLEAFFTGHDDLERALEGATPADFARPIPLPRWAERFPLVGDAVVHLALHHESAHLGQLSAWRRACGLPPV
ncbi:MAG: DinB family protein [Phycisphaerales bacterium]